MVVGFQVPLGSELWHRKVVSGQKKNIPKGTLIVVSVLMLKSRRHLDLLKAETLVCLEIISVNPH